MNILIINVADSGARGRDCQEAFRKRYPAGEKRLLNALPLLLSYINGDEDTEATNIESLPEMKKWNHIVLCVHGIIDNIEICQMETNFERSELMTCKVGMLARLFYNQIGHFGLLEDGNKIPPVTLSICYAARSDAYQIDHVRDKSAVDFTRTFAYNFLRSLLCFNAALELQLNAYTGAVSFNFATGNLECQSEEQIAAMPRLEELAADMSVLGQKLEALEHQGDESSQTFLQSQERYNTLYRERIALEIQLAKRSFNYGLVQYTVSNRQISIDISRLKPNVANTSSASQPTALDSDPDEQICTIFSGRRP